jgi:predicted enzyme related to lactoylglutathione lyase
MARVIHFEIPADNPEQSMRYYKEVFGWEFTKWEGPQPYWLVTTGPKDQPGIDGGLMARPKGPGAVTVNTVQVDNVDDCIKVVEKAGGKVCVPKMAIQGVGWLAYCTDPEGIVTGIMQMDPNAK